MGSGLALVKDLHQAEGILHATLDKECWRLGFMYLQYTCTHN